MTLEILKASLGLQVEIVAAAGMATSEMVGVHQSIDQARSANISRKRTRVEQCASNTNI